MSRIMIEEKPSLEELQHYGVIGMKWGMRRGGLTSRFRGAIADKAQRDEQVRTRRIEGRSKGLQEKLGTGVDILRSGGKKRMLAKNEKRIEQDRQRQVRMEKGKLKAKDILSGIGSLGGADFFTRGDVAAGITDLLVSRRDKRG